MSDEVTSRTRATGWRNSPQIMAGIDGALTVAGAAVVGLVVAMFIDNVWTLPEKILLPLLATVGLLGAPQRVTQRRMDLLLTPRRGI